MKEQIMIEKEKGSGRMGRKAVVIVYALLLCALNFVRVFDHNFWADECYSIRLSKMGFWEMIQETAQDVHPPLYYTFLQLTKGVSEFNGSIYRFVSWIPYGIMIIFALHVIWKKFGKEPAILFLSFASLLNSAVTYNVQVRMYSWGALFLLLSFYSFYEILERNRIVDYMGFMLMSIAAAYTHYYCLISVAFFYLALIIVALVRRKQYFLRTCVVAVLTILAYIPWFMVLLATFNRTSQNYWMTEIPTIMECLMSLFCSKFQDIYMLICMIAVCGSLKSEIRIIEPESVQGKKRVTLGNTGIWILTGLFSIFGTILTGIIVSKSYRPMFTTRYLYPVSVVSWLILGISIAKYEKKHMYTAILLALILTGGLMEYRNIERERRYQEERLDQTLELTAENFSKDDIIVTDSRLLDWTILDYYYPDHLHQPVDLHHLPQLDGNMGYWLITEYEIDTDMTEVLKKQERRVEEIVDEGILGTHRVYIYRLQ